MTAVWDVRGLSAGYGAGPAVLRDVDLDLAPGRVVAVVGGDGAGKTTLLRCLAGGLAARTGQLRLPPPDRVGYLSEVPGVYPDLTVVENLAFCADAFGLDRATRRRRTTELLEATDLVGAADRLAANLSGGMRQRLAFAAATIHDPELLLLDEATTGVDPLSRRALFRLVARSAATGTAVLLSTSYLDEAERAATVLVLHEGRPLLAGSAAEVLGAVPGAVYDLPSRPVDSDMRAWRRGRRWRVWCPPGAPTPDAAAPARLDLEDAVIIAQLSGGVPRTEAVAR